MKIKIHNLNENLKKKQKNIHNETQNNMSNCKCFHFNSVGKCFNI